MTYSGGGGGNTLILQGALPGGPFATEVYNATGPGAGNITLGSSTINFTGLKPVVDTTPATNFTFNYTGGLDARINVGSGATVNGLPTTLISTSSISSEFEQESYANKANVTINTGSGNDVVAVTGSALLTGSSTTINGQAGSNILNYDAGGSTVVIAPTGTPGQATITRAGSGPLLVENFSQINVVNGQIQGVPITPPILSSTTAITGYAGAPLTNVDVATFVASGTNTPNSSLSATINWGDGIITAGTIVPDASSPTVYHVEGSHTYVSPSSSTGYSILVTVGEAQTNTSTVLGVPITQINSASTSNTALIAGLKVVPGFELTKATEGQEFEGAIAEFTTGTTAAVPSQFNAAVQFSDGTTFPGLVTVDPTSPGQFEVRVSRYFEVAGYISAMITLQDTASPVANTLTIPASILVQGVGLIGSSNLSISTTVNSPYSGLVATFISQNPAAPPASYFLATIDWGDGSTPTAGVIIAHGNGAFDVNGSHTYMKSPGPDGSFPISVAIQETQYPATTTATTQAFVSDAKLTAAGATLSTTSSQPDSQALVASFLYDGGLVPLTNFSGTINWGDGTTSPFTSSNITAVGTSTAGTSYLIQSAHTYSGFGTFPVSVTINSIAGSSGAAQGSAIVTDSPITTPVSPSGINATEGTLFSGTIASFADSSGAADSFQALIAWGDGHISQGTVTAGTTPNSFDVSGTNTFAAAGSYSATISIRHTAVTGGSIATIAVPVHVSDPLTVTVLPPTPVENLQFYNLAIATFSDGESPYPASKYSATINYGDGSAIIPGTIVANADGTFSVFSSHMYTLPGVFPLTVTVTNDLDGITSGTANVTVTPAALNVVGHLNPSSDSGESDTDAITNDVRPNFYGTAAPGTVVSLVAIPVGSSTAIPIGSTVADGSGAWSITSITLADGRYTIQATGTDSAGITKALDVILPNPLQGYLTIDTVAPKVESVLYEPLKGQILVSFQDNSTGLDQAQVDDGANYSFARVMALPNQAHLKKGSVPLPRNFLVTGLSATAPGDPTAAEDVVITLNDGNPIRGGSYRFTITSGGIQDVAGNALDGEFYGDFPSGNNIPGGDFVAELVAVHNTVYAPAPVGSSASPVTPVGTLPTATTIPTVKEYILKNGKPTLVLVKQAPATKAPVAKTTATKATVVHGKASPHPKPAVKPASPAKKAAPKHHG